MKPAFSPRIKTSAVSLPHEGPFPSASLLSYTAVSPGRLLIAPTQQYPSQWQPKAVIPVWTTMWDSDPIHVTCQPEAWLTSRSRASSCKHAKGRSE